MSILGKNKAQADDTPSAIADYLDTDFSGQSAIATQLLAGLDNKSQNDELTLSDIIGPQPANVTPHMETWYNNWIATKREPALHSVMQLAKERCEASKGEGFLLPIRLGSFDEELLINKRKCYKDHKDKFNATSQKIAALEKTLSSTQQQYNVRKAQLGGREANILNRPLYFLVMVFVLFASEAALNLESFEALPWATPAIAWGATIIIGIAIGLSAHFHGTVLKQYDYYFNPAENNSKRGPAWQMVLGGTATLIFALWFVYYARSAYLISYVSSLGAFGQSGNAPNFLWIVGGSLLGNMLVYLTGSLWAYLMHDADPQFVEWKVEIEKLSKEVAALKTQMERARAREVEQIIARHRKSTEEAKQAYKQIAGLPSLAWPQELFTKIQAKDILVIGMLQNYKQNLVKNMGASSKDAAFHEYCDDPYVVTRTITSTDFLRSPVKLKYLEGA